MRVIAGTLRGRRLVKTPPDVRPTSDRVREALFATLGDVTGAKVLDLYAGTGALGIEALSRGAEHATFVDRSARSLEAVRANLEALDLNERARVVRGDAAGVLRRWSRAPAPGSSGFDLALLDPPYDAGALESVLAELVRAGVLAAGATVVVESTKRHSLGPVDGLVAVDRREYGDTTITRLVPSSGDEARGSADEER